MRSGTPISDRSQKGLFRSEQNCFLDMFRQNSESQSAAGQGQQNLFASSHRVWPFSIPLLVHPIWEDFKSLSRLQLIRKVIDADPLRLAS
jgi:hypothetical protein